MRQFLIEFFNRVFPMNNPNQFMMQPNMMDMQRYQAQFQPGFQKFGYTDYNPQMQYQMEGNMQGQWSNQPFHQNPQNTKPFHKGNLSKGTDKNQKGSSGFRPQNQGHQSNQLPQLTKQDISSN